MDQEKNLETGRLSKALSTFAATPRYTMLKTLQVGRFVDDGPMEIGVLSEYTFEKLIELGSKKISKLRWLTPVQEERLLTLLAALSEQDESSALPPPLRVQRSSMARELIEEDEVGSVKLELDLRETLKSLRAHERYASVRDKTLGQYWDPTWARAPFEEAFTVDQLAHMDLAMLFKKRSTSNRRVRHMIEALGRVLGSLRGGPENERCGNTQVREARCNLGMEEALLARSETEQRVDAPHPWVYELEQLSLSGRGPLFLLGTAGASFLLASCEAMGNSREPSVQALASFPDTFSVHELMEVLDHGALRPELRERLQGWIHSHEGLGQVCAALREALRGPGIHIANLARCLPTFVYLPKAIQMIMCHILVRALGAQQISLGKLVVRDVWTLNPNLLPLILKEIKRHKSSRPVDVLSTVCPEMDQFLLTLILESHGGSSREGLSVRKNGISSQRKGRKRASPGSLKA